MLPPTSLIRLVPLTPYKFQGLALLRNDSTPSSRKDQLRLAREQFLKPWEVVYIPLGGSKELQEAQPFAPQCGIDAQEQQIVAYAIFRKGRTHDAPSGCNTLIAFSATLLFHDTPSCDKNVKSLVPDFAKRR
jgi:hypothetical protein